MEERCTCVREPFEIWGWRFEVERAATEFLNLTEVSCSSLTLRGTGKVTVTVPASCGTGVGGLPTFVVDLGPSQATDEPPVVGPYSIYGLTITQALEPLE